MKLTPANIRSKLLKEQGLTEYKPEPRKHKRFKPIIEPSIGGTGKTPLMRYLEQRYGEAIEKILLSGSLSVVRKRLDNEVDTSTLSRWIKRFKLRYTVDNLPNCLGCRHYGPACDSGVCYLLIELELWDLIPIKKKEVLDDSGLLP